MARLIDQEQPRLPEHAFPFQNLKFEETRCFLFNRFNKELPLIVTGFRDRGPGEAILPVIKGLIEKANLIVFSDSLGRLKLRDSVTGFTLSKKTRSISQKISEVVQRANVVLVPVSANLGIEAALMANSLWEKDPKKRPFLIGLEDYPGVWGRQRKARQIPEWLIPDLLLVVNQWSAEKELEYLPNDFDPNKIIVTGQPASDSLARENPSLRQEARTKMGVDENTLLIAFVGTVFPPEEPFKGITNSLTVLVDAIKKAGINNFKLVVRPHPADRTSPETISEILESLREHAVDSSEMTTDGVIAAANLVISGGSTTGLMALLQGIPPIDLLLPNKPMTHQEILKKFPLPQVESGTSILASSLEELTTAIQDTLDPLSAPKLRKKMEGWKTDGGATKRVSDIVLEKAYENMNIRNSV